MAKNDFYINYHGNNIAVSKGRTINKNERRYLIHLPEGDIEIYKKEDNEGANHWFEAGKDNATVTSTEIGLMIEQTIK